MAGHAGLRSVSIAGRAPYVFLKSDALDADDSGMGVEPWIELVVSYQTLLYRAPTPAVCLQLAKLRQTLRGDEFDRRDFRRFAASLDARLRKNSIEAPCRVFDLGAGGFGVINESHVAVTQGDCLTLILEVQEGAERIDFPCRVSHVDDSRHYIGLSSAGAPLRMRRPRRLPAAFFENTAPRRAA